MTPDKPEPPAPSTDKPEVEQNPEQSQPPKYPSLSRLDFAKLPKGSRLSAVTFPSGERWEWDENNKLTKFKPQ